MTLSSTIDRTKIGLTKLLDQAFAKARIKPQQITSEMLEQARVDLDLMLKSMSEDGVKLWARDAVTVRLRVGQQYLPLPEGTTDIDDVQLRKFTYVSPLDIVAGTTSIMAALGLAGNTSLIYAPLTFASAATLEGDYELQIAFNTTNSRKLTISTSPDNLTFSAPQFLLPAVDLNKKTINALEYEVLPITVPAGTKFIVLADSNGLALNVQDLLITRGGSGFPLIPWGSDELARMSDQKRPGKPSNYRAVRLVDGTKVELWPVPDGPTAATHDLVIWRRRAIMDAGRFTNTLDLPSRWLEAIVWHLAWRIAQREPESQADWAAVRQVANDAEMRARETERVQGPIRVNFYRRAR